MSQLIQKFESGGSPARTIKKGNKTINLDDFLSDLDFNYDNWANTRKWSDKEREETRKAYQEMVRAYDRGELRPEYGGISTGNSDTITDTLPYQRAQSFINLILQQQPEYTEPKSTKTAWNNEAFISELNKRLFNGNTNFNEDFLKKDNFVNGKRGITKRAELISAALNNFDSVFANYEVSDADKANFQKGIIALQKALADGKIEDSERMDLSNLGLDVDKYFYTGENYTDDEEPEVEKTDLEKAQEVLTNAQTQAQIDNINQQAELTRLRNQFMQLENPNLSLDLSKYSYTTPTIKYAPNSEVAEIHDNWIRSVPELLENYIINHNIYNLSEKELNEKVGDTYSNHFGVMNQAYKGKNSKWRELNPEWTKGQALAYLLDLMAKQTDEQSVGDLVRTPEGHIIMNIANGYTRVYDPISRRMYNIASKNIPGAIDAELQRKGYQIPSNKEGGVIKAAFGFKASGLRTNDEIKAEHATKRAETEKKQVEDKASSQGRTVKQQEAADRKIGDNLTTIDQVRMGAIAADLTGALLSFTGAGSIGGGILGLGSTAANLYADWNDDSISAEDMWKNAATGAAFSAIGFIPGFGGTSMLGKTIAGAIKYVPKALAAINAGLIVADDNVQESLHKFTKDFSMSDIANPTDWFKRNDITQDDLRNLAMFFGSVSGLTRMSNNSVKKRIQKHSMTTNPNNTYSIKTADGKTVTLTAEQYNAFKQAKTTTEANAVLHSIQGQENASVTSARRFKIAGKKDKFNQKSLTHTKGQTTYSLDPNKEMTWLGKLYIGDPNNKFSDAGLIVNQLNNTYHPFSNGIFYKKKQNAPITRTQPVPTVQIATKYLNPNKVHDFRGKSDISFNSKRQYDLNQIKQYLVSIGKLKDSDTIKGATLSGRDLYFWQKGGKVLKGQSGLEVPTWFVDRYKNHTKLGNWTPQLSYSKRAGSDIENFRGDAGSLNTVFSANQAYTTDNHDNITADIQGYYNKLGGQNFKSAADFVKAYNESAAKIRGIFDNDIYYRSGNGFNATDATEHNNLFRDMFSSRSIAKGDITGRNLGFDESMVGQAGSSTWHRRMDQYENEWDGQDQSRVHTIIGTDGKSFKVYKKANGDIDLVPENPTDTQQSLTQTTKSTQVDPVTGKSVTVHPIFVNELSNQKSKVHAFLQEALPQFYGIGRLAGTLRTNSKIYDIMRKGIQPRLLSTYERYSPITGAFSTIQFFNDQAADLNRKAKQQFTSDAQIQLGTQLEAARQARDIEKQGFLADDQEIKRTQAEALARTEDNMARRDNVANKNVFELANTRREKSQLLADYKLKQWNAIAGWLTEQQQRGEQNLERYRNFKLAVDQQNAKQRYEDQLEPYKQAVYAWRQANPTGNISTSAPYRTLIAKSRELAREMQNTQYQSMANAYMFPYSPDKPRFIYKRFNS